MKKKQRKWRRKKKKSKYRTNTGNKIHLHSPGFTCSISSGCRCGFLLYDFWKSQTQTRKKTKSERTKILKQTGCLFFSTNQKRSKKGKPFQNRIPSQHSFLGNFSAYDKCCGAKIFAKKNRHLEKCHARCGRQSPRQKVALLYLRSFLRSSRRKPTDDAQSCWLKASKRWATESPNKFLCYVPGETFRIFSVYTI